MLLHKFNALLFKIELKIENLLKNNVIHVRLDISEARKIYISVPGRTNILAVGLQGLPILRGLLASDALVFCVPSVYRSAINGYYDQWMEPWSIRYHSKCFGLKRL